MVRLREIPRTAAFAWSPGSSKPLIATGTVAGAVNDSFSDDTTLELWDLSLSDKSQGVELAPIASTSSDSRFHDIAWVLGKEKGLIAGALENGSLDIWDAEKLLNSDTSAKVSRTTKHTGPIKAVQFNPFKPELLATAGAKEELYIWDTNNIENPFKLGNTAATATDFECLEWNKRVPHILATGSNGGFVTVWDVKNKKQNLTLNNYGRKPVSAIAWDPEKPTRLITAVSLETDPVVLVWDLRNANAPERVLQGHQGGVLSLSWCPQDPDLLLSCGKDNRTICWNPQTGEQYGEFPVVTNWTFQTRWNPHNPSLLATASFDGKISIQTIQSTKKEVTTPAGAPVSDEDFFSANQDQPQGSTFNLFKAPKWLLKPSGASFGFGGKVVSFKPDASGLKSVVKISKFTIDDEIGKLAESFESSLTVSNLTEVCKTRAEEAKTESEKADWKVMEALVASNPRKEIISYLGFSEPPVTEATDGEAKSEEKLGDDDDGFFDKPVEDAGFLNGIAATKDNKTGNPFHLYTADESEANKNITKALMLGQFDKAMEICLSEDRLSDAFMIATCGGPASIEKAQKAFFKKQSSGPQYIRLLASVIGKNLWDIVHNADLANWKETMVAICTYADSNEFPELCEALGDRIEKQLLEQPHDADLKQSAAFCYMTGSKLEKVVGLWLTDLKESETKGLEGSTNGSAFSIHARSLQQFVEKVTIFRDVTKYQDSDLSAISDWKLANLYDKYLEYADIAASHGQMGIAQKYLDLLPVQYANAEVARNRVQLATQKPRTAPTGRQSAAVPTTTGRPATNIVPTYENATTPYSAPAPAPVSYGATPQPMRNAYTPSATSVPPVPPAGPGPYLSTGNPYTPAQPIQQQPQRQQFGNSAPANTFTMLGGPPPMGGPPRGPSPSVPPPSQAKNMVNWNDTPEDFFAKPKPVSRRATPSVLGAAVTSPFQGQGPPGAASPPIGSGSIPPPPRGSAAGPPPPKGSVGPPPRMGTPSNSYMPTASSASTSAYAPQVQPGSTLPHPVPPPVARGASPYQPPPSAMGPQAGNRYAPSPASQPAQMPLGGGPPPPGNPYAHRQGGPGAVQPPMTAAAPPPPRAAVGPPPGGPPRGPPQGPPRSSSSPAPPPPRAQPATATQNPAGDRTHIPDHARPVFELLNEDVQRVKAKAPQNYMPHVLDTEKRLNILFDNINNGTLLKPNTVEDMVQLAQAIKAKNYEQASSIQISIETHRTDECGNWMVGVKRLIGMSRATP